MQDMKISGSGTIAPGTYGKVSISGSGQASGPIDCEDFIISGSGRVTGPLHCRSFKASGSFRSEGEILCRENFECSGSGRVEGLVCAEGKAEVSGSLKGGVLTGGRLAIFGSAEAESISVGNLQVSGGLKVSGDVEAEQAEFAGVMHIQGLLNVEELKIFLGPGIGRSTIGAIGCGHMKTQYSGTTGAIATFLSRLGARGKGSLEVGEIEGDIIELEGTHAGIVRGAEVVIGPGCVIDRIEYINNLYCDPSSEIGLAVRVGENELPE